MGDSKAKSQLMMQAASEGQAGVRQAHDRLMAEKHRTQEVGLNAAAQIGAGVADAQARGFQGENIKKAEEAAAEKEQFDRDYKVGEQSLAQQRIDLEAQKSGIERTSDENIPPHLQGRAAKLKEDMDRGAKQTEQDPQQQGPPPPTKEEVGFAKQGSSPLQVAGPRGGFAPSAQLQQDRKAQAGMAERQMQTAEMNARANWQNATNKLNAANNKGTAGAADAKAANDSLLNQLGTKTKEITDVVNGVITPDKIAQQYGDNPQIQQMMQQGGVPKERAVQFLKNQLASQQIDYMSQSGFQAPNMDPSNPIIKQFNSRFAEVASAMRGAQNILSMDVSQQDAFDQATTQQDTRAINQAWKGITSYDERQNFLYKLTGRIFKEADMFRQQAAMSPTGSGMRQKVTDLEGQVMQLQQQLQQQREMALSSGIQQAPEQGGANEQPRSAGSGQQGSVEPGPLLQSSRDSPRKW